MEEQEHTELMWLAGGYKAVNTSPKFSFEAQPKETIWRSFSRLKNDR